MAALAPPRPHSRTSECARSGARHRLALASHRGDGGTLLLAADLAGLAGLAPDLLAGVADALALVRLGLAGRTDLRGDLADELLVDPDDREARGVLDLEADPGRRIDLDLVAVAEVQRELLAVLRGPV